MEDILIFGKNAAEHEEHLKEVLKILEQNKFYAKLSKCDFNRSELLYLGHIVGAYGIRVDPAKIAAVSNWPVPKDLHDMRSFLGLTDYFREFVQGYATGYQVDAVVQSLVHSGALSSAHGLLWHGDALVVPAHESLRKDIMYNMHDSSIAGHPGMRMTKNLVRREYWWPAMDTEIEAYVQTCATVSVTRPGQPVLQFPYSPWRFFAGPGSQSPWISSQRYLRQGLATLLSLRLSVA